MPTIRQLPPSVINKIAAGEVIERPASVVKELVENSVDAGATRIDVSLEQGGMELVRVSDNGCGIEPAQLPLAIASHATSKIVDADDLFRVRTLGFRGEALASIAEISNFLLRSRATGLEAGAQLEVRGGEPRPVEPVGCPVGTTIEVRNLFFNTPVRRKFTRSTQTEMGHCIEAFTRIAIAFPQVHFTLRHNERLIHELPPVINWRERIVKLFGPEFENGLIAVENQEGEVRLSGFAADPSLSRANNRMQYLLLNGRYIRDRSLQHALAEAYRGLLLTGRQPIAFLRLDLPPEIVDVNVHPTKLEVRFQDSGRIYSQLLGSLRKRFLQTDLTAKVRAATPVETPPSVPTFVGETTTEGEDDPRRELLEWARGQTTPAAAVATAPVESRQAKLEFAPPPVPDVSNWRREPVETPRDEGWLGLSLRSPSPADSTTSSSFTGPAGASKTQPQPPGATPTLAALTIARRPDPQHETPARSHLGMQFQNRYLVAEQDDGIVVIDQHALHERILYEQIREKVLAGTLERQRLLVPEPVTLPPAEAAVALDARETLSQLGIEIEPFGGDTVLITSYPAMLANLGPAEMLRQTIDQLLTSDKPLDRRDLLDELLHMVSCKAAIKAGDRLTPEEITALLERRELCQDAHHCPHGRPTALVFSRDELDKRFKRI